MELKYAIVDYNYPYIFTAASGHKDILGNVTSAGFFRVHSKIVTCYGYSSSLGIGPQEDDSAILQRFIDNLLKEEKP